MKVRPAPTTDLRQGPPAAATGGNPMAAMTSNQAAGGAPILPDFSGQPMTRADAKRARTQLENDPVKGKALRDSKHPRHKAVVSERGRLLAMENGDGSND